MCSKIKSVFLRQIYTIASNQTKLNAVEGKCTTTAVAPNQTNNTTNAQVQEILKKVPLLPTFNLSAYVKESSNLQQLVKLGVDLHKVEKRKGLAQFLLNQQSNDEIANTLLFLQDKGIPMDSMGQWLTKNPLIFKEDLNTLQTRIDYLTELKLTKEQQVRIINLNPFWLMFSIDRIEKRLGFFQRHLALRSKQVLDLAVKQPRLITYNLTHIREALFCLLEEMGFTSAEMRTLLLNKPRLCMLRSNDLVERFAYAHKDMQLSHSTLLKFPEVLCSRYSRLCDRHEFLKLLGRAHYDPKHDLYISPDEVVSGNDDYFCRYVAKCELKVFETFLRTR